MLSNLTWYQNEHEKAGFESGARKADREIGEGGAMHNTARIVSNIIISEYHVEN